MPFYDINITEIKKQQFYLLLKNQFHPAAWQKARVNPGWVVLLISI